MIRLGLSTLFLLFAILCSGCGPDRGRCVLGHDHRVPMWIQVIIINNHPMTIVHPAYTRVDCDVWEFPNGRPLGKDDFAEFKR